MTALAGLPRQPMLVALLVALHAALLPSAGLAAPPGDTLRVSLEQVLDHARQASPLILAARRQVAQVEGQRLSSLAGFLPHLTLSEVFNRGTDPVFAFGSRLRQSSFGQDDFQIEALNHPAALNNFATRVVVEQPLFNGGRSLYGRRQVGEYLEAARSFAGSVEQGALFQVRQAYYSVILARESLGVIEAALRAADSHRRQAERMLEGGQVTRADVLKSGVRVAELQQQRIQVENRVTVAVEHLKLAAGWRTEEFLLPAGEREPGSFQVQPDTLIAYALHHRGELNAARNAARAAEYGSRAARGELIPQLNGFFQYERDADEIFAGDGDNWMVGVSLDWNVFDGLGNLGRIRSADARQAQAEDEARLIDHRVEVEVREAYLEAGAAREMIAVARQAAEESRESLRILENQYREGLATITDLLDTETAATAGGLRLVEARYGHQLALARLALVTGGYPGLAQTEQ